MFLCSYVQTELEAIRVTADTGWNKVFKCLLLCSILQYPDSSFNILIFRSLALLYFSKHVLSHIKKLFPDLKKNVTHVEATYMVLYMVT